MQGAWVPLLVRELRSHKLQLSPRTVTKEACVQQKDPALAKVNDNISNDFFKRKSVEVELERPLRIQPPQQNFS